MELNISNTYTRLLCNHIDWDVMVVIVYIDYVPHRLYSYYTSKDSDRPKIRQKRILEYSK